MSHERKIRLRKSVITHDMGKCKICGNLITSGMIHLCDDCFNKYDKMEFIITEGVESVWSYHWSKPDNFTRSLCGKWTMKTERRNSSWRKSGHLHEKYCKECEKLREGGNRG